MMTEGRSNLRQAYRDPGGTRDYAAQRFETPLGALLQRPTASEVDRRTPPRVTYWTGAWNPAQEGISKEIQALRTGDRVRAPVVAFAPHQPARIAWQDRVVTLPVQAWIALRAVAALIEPAGELTHIFGGHVSWHHLRALGRRPILLTAVIESGPTDVRLPADPAGVVVETDSSVAEWIDAGIPRDRIHIVRPGVPLETFSPLPRPSGRRFTLLFASTPSDPDDIGPRGIPLLIELARVRPDIDVIVPWRQWGDIAGAERVLAGLRPPTNFIVTRDPRIDMRAVHARAHATVVCFAKGAGKAVPNFVLEGLACGRPAIATRGGLSDVLVSHRAGVVIDADVHALSAAVDRLQADWAGWSERAALLARTEFDLERFRAAYDKLYTELAAPSRADRSIAHRLRVPRAASPS